jgi:Methyltransferase domain
MFVLNDADLGLRILGCADGPASFNAESARRGTAVVSMDPLYRLDTTTIRARIAATYDQILEQARRNSQQFAWDTIQSVEELGRIRMQAMEKFLDDYDEGKRQGRYVAAELPTIPFPDQSFDLAVCSHFLFLYTEHLSEAFHHSAIQELCRVAREVRGFSLAGVGWHKPCHMSRVL